MKKLFIWVAAVALCVSCSQEETTAPPVGGDNGLIADGEARYLTVNIAAATAGTRADDDPKYEDGSGTENYVSNVRFYFFNENGTAAAKIIGSSNDTKYAYYDWTPTDDPANPNYPNESETVEDRLSATIIINSKLLDENPADDVTKESKLSIVAVVNLPTDELDELDGTRTSITSVSDLKDVVNDYAKEANSNTFIMSNSVYIEGSEAITEKDVVKIAADKFKTTPEDAKNDPVTIYVERVVAKANVTVSMEAAATVNDRQIYNTKETFEQENEGSDNKIYVEFLGWNVTTTADKARLVKSINKDWGKDGDNNLFQTANEPWSVSDFHRSYWAINPTDIKYNYGTFAEEDASGKSGFHNGESGFDDVNPAQAKKGFNIATSIYLQENAGMRAGTTSPWAEAAVEKPTQVIIAAQLLQKNGEGTFAPLQLAKYLGQMFANNKGDDDKAVKEMFLQTLNNKPGNKYYTESSSSDGKTHYRLLNEDDVTIKTAWEAGEASESKSGRYKVYLQMKTIGSDTKWYTINPADVTDNGELKSDEDLTALKNAEGTINNTLKELGTAEIWTNGYTYYFFNIQHLARPTIGGIVYGGNNYDTEKAAEVPGYYGVVRNHVYKCDIKSLAGLGTPVYNPNEIIIPEKPEDTETYVGAEIRILSWRIVNNGVDLNWGNN